MYEAYGGRVQVYICTPVEHDAYNVGIDLSPIEEGTPG